MKDLILSIGLDEKRFKFAQIDDYSYNVGVFEDDNRICNLKVVLMPTGNSEELPRFTMTPNANIPNWLLHHNIPIKLDQHIKSQLRD